MTFSGPELLVFATFAALLSGVVGGYGGLKLLARGLMRELAEMGADLESFDLRIKKLEGRKVREDQATKRGAPPPEIQELTKLLGGPRAVPRPSGEETEAEIIARTFGAPPKKAQGDE